MSKSRSSIGYYVLFFAFLFLINVYPLKSAHSQFSCLPTCSEIDSKFFVFIGDNPNGVQNQTMNFGITSPASADSVEIGIFDGDSPNSDWDFVVAGPGINMTFTLFADPQGDGTGTLQVAQWSTNGILGDNPGDPMLNNAWFTRVIQNTQQAIAENGDYKYNLFIEIVGATTQSDRNSFKVRTDGFLLLFPLQMFNFNSLVSQNADLTLGTGDFHIVFPDLDLFDPSCADPLVPFPTFCNATLPSCCLFNSTYDGMWSFFFRLPPDVVRLPIWDGDFDFGSSIIDPNDPDNLLCIVGGPDVDTDDPNTGPIIPFFALDTESVIQGISTPTFPFDNVCNGFAPRLPSAQYSFVDPNGVEHNNVNPSGNAEWELFSLTNVPPLDPLVDDLLVADFPEGLWQVKTVGLDMFNVNLFFFEYPIIGVNEEGEPVEPPDDPRSVPTLSQWGLIATAGLLGIIGFIVIRRRQLTTNS